MTNARRVALIMIAAQMLVAPAAFAQSSGTAGRAGGASNAANDDDEDDEEEEEDEPAAASNARAANADAPPASQSSTSSPQAPSGPANPDFVTGETEEQAEARRERMLPRFSALDGAVGLLHMATAETGSNNSFRFGLLAEYFSQTGFLRPTDGLATPTGMPDDANHIGATFTLAYSPIRYLEIFAALRSYANSNSSERPTLFQVLGDSNLGVKGVYPVFRGMTVGASAAVNFLNRAGDIGLALASTSANFRLLGTFDLQPYVPAVPVRFHANVGYFLDNSEALVSDVEARRRMADPAYDPTVCSRPFTTDRADPINNNPACHTEISRAERFALGINRADRFNVGIAVDLPLTRYYVHPFLEWNVGVPVVRNGYICYDAPTGTGDDDACLAGDFPRGTGNAIDQFARSPSALTIGTRVLPPIRGLSALVAVDIATGGAQYPFVRELAPITPWMFYFGAGFAHDFAPHVKRLEVPRDVVRNVDASPVRGAILGRVTDAETHQPVVGAVLDVVGHPDFGLVATDAQGQYRTREIVPGAYQLHVRALDYTENTCAGTIPAPQGSARTVPDVTVNCELRAVPRMGNLGGRVTNARTNAGVAGVTVTLNPGQGIVVPQGQTAPATQTATTGADGTYQFANLPSGQYSVVAGQSANTMAASPRTVDVRPRETANGDIAVNPVDNRGIRITRGAIDVRDQVHFQTDSAEILPDSNTLLERIADFINRHPEAERIEIQGHTDNQGTPAHNQTLSQNRAESVRAALVNLGVDPSRLAARGYGQTRPVAPNITPGGRARNRRVMFVITQRAGATPRAAQ